jgi:small-conductance mechanosensitive channel
LGASRKFVERPLNVAARAAKYKRGDPNPGSNPCSTAVAMKESTMQLERVFANAERRLVDLGRRLWEDPALRWREQMDAFCQRLGELEAARQRDAAEGETVRARLSRREIEAAMLASRIEACVFAGDPDRAFWQALELDQMRQALRHDRDQLDALRDNQRHLTAAISQLQTRLALLQECRQPLPL